MKRTLSKDHTVPAKTVITNSRLWNMIMVEKKVDEALNERKAAATFTPYAQPQSMVQSRDR
ncbi:MAG: hypothetical protein WDO15_03515 [Bacteroidota bacterium]